MLYSFNVIGLEEAIELKVEKMSPDRALMNYLWSHHKCPTSLLVAMKYGIHSTYEKSK